VTLTNLAVAGTYTVRVIPPSGQLGTVVVGLSGKDIITIGAAAKAVNQKGVMGFSFTGTAGQRLGIGLVKLVTTPSNGYLSVYVYKPDGTQLTNFTASGAASGYALPILPVGGTYQIVIQPGNNKATYNLLLTADATGVLTSGSALTFKPTREGQAASYTFNATAGQSLNLQITGNTFIGYTYLYVYKPDETQLTYTYYYGSAAGASGTLALNNLPVAGTYTVRVIPPSGVLGSATIKLQ
jgi:hypothetical protein